MTTRPGDQRVEGGVRVLATGMLVAQVVALAATPLLTRLYAPSAFGLYALFVAIVAVMAPIAALRFDAALPLPDAEDDALALARLAVFAALGVSIITTVVVASLFLWNTTTSIMAHDAQRILWWLPAGVLLTGLFQIAVALEVRGDRHHRAAGGRATQGISTAVAQCALGATSSGVGAGLIVGDLCGRLVSLLTVGRGLRQAFRRSVDVTQLTSIARRYRGFASYASSAAVINSCNAALPMLAVGLFFGLETAGLLLLAQRVASLPTALLTTAVSQVFAVELSRTPHAHERRSLFRSTIGRLARVSIVPFVVIAVSAPFLFAPLFGPDWLVAGRVAAAVVPFYFLQLLSGATMSAVDVMQAHKSRLVREGLFLGGMLVVLSTARFADLDLLGVALSYATFGVAFYAGSLTWIDRRLRDFGAW